MNQELFELIIKVVLTLLTIFLTYVLVPWLKANTSSKQRENAIYLITLGCTIAESLYKTYGTGYGKVKKEWVINWLKERDIQITESEIDALIDNVVDIMNTYGWNALNIIDKTIKLE